MRKKFTLLFAALLACVGVVKAEVNNELLSKKITIGTDATTLSTDQWYVLYNHGRGVCVSEETTAFKMRSIPANDAVAQNVAGMLFKLTAVEDQSGQYYIESGNGLYFNFVQNNASTVSNEPVAYEVKTIGENAGHFYIKHVQDGWVADGQGNGEGFVCWNKDIPTSVGGNNCYHFKPVTLTEVVLVDVTYNYYVGGKLKHTEVVADQIEGSDPAAPTFGFVSFEAPTDPISESNKVFNIDCTLADAPLTFSTTDAPVWQTVEMHRYSGSFRIWNYTGEELVSVTEMGSDRMGVVDDSKLWCFVGDHFGFKIYNKEAGFGKTLNPTSGNPTMGQADGNDEWFFAKSTASQDANAVCFTSRNTTYMNRQGSGKIGYYSAADNGSTCYFTAPEHYFQPAAVEFCNLLANYEEVSKDAPENAAGIYKFTEEQKNAFTTGVEANPKSIGDMQALYALANEIKATAVVAAGYYFVKNTGDAGNNASWYLTHQINNGKECLWANVPSEGLNADYVWKFESYEDGYKIQSVALGKYFQMKTATNSGDNNTYIENDRDQGEKFLLNSQNYSGKFIIKNSDSENIRTEDGGQVNYWSGENNESWYLVPLTDEEMSLCGFVAKVETEYLKTLQDAINAATAEKTIDLISDITLDKKIDINEVVTLNLNGKTITRTGEGYAFEVTGELILEGAGSINGGIHYIINDNDYKQTEKAYAMSADKVGVDISYIRSFGHNNWQVLYVPFDIPVASMSEFDVYAITNASDKAVDVVKVTEGTLTAHTPYLIKAKSTGDKTIFVEKGTLLKAAPENDYSQVIGGYTFTGTYAAKKITAETEYVLTGGEWCQLDNSNQVLGAFRVYLTVDGSAAPVLRIMTRGEEDTTAIDSAVLNAQPSSVIYDLLGRRVEKMDKGIYIVNGRKVVVK